MSLRNGLPAEAAKADVRRILRRDVDLTTVTADDAGLGHSAGIDRAALRLSYPTLDDGPPGNGSGETAALALTAAMNTRAPSRCAATVSRLARGVGRSSG